MKQKENIILIGGGGHCKSCIEVIEATGKFNIIGILDKVQKVGEKVLRYDVLGTDNDIKSFADKGFSFLVTVGQIKSADARVRIFNSLKTSGAKIATVISPLASVSKHATIGIGTIIMHFVAVNAAATVGENVILNTGCNVEHDASVGGHTHISTHAVVNGDSKIGKHCFIGSNATISSQIIIGNRVVIGAGSVVIRDISGDAVYAGNPAQQLKND